jgi:hypothetical protein
VKRRIADHLKNLRGWRTSRKLVAFAVDDYANVRVASVAARERLVAAGLDLSGQMDRYDTLETRQDLEALFEVLESVRDGKGQPAVFTPYALAANPDFAAIREDGTQYHPEPVTRTFQRLAAEQPHAYEGAWALWQEGMARGLVRPQCHGREHLNVALFEHKLRQRAPDLLANLEHDSLAGITSDPAMPAVEFTHAFGLHDRAELARHREILADTFDAFKQVWGYRSTTFTPPALLLHPDLQEELVQYGVESIDKPLRCSRPLGDGAYKREINHSGRQRGQNHTTVVRNVVFEPGKDMGFELVSRALEQMQAAFFFGRPAIISSHRVNFCGHIDERYRKNGLDALSRLLAGIVQRWPEVEFVSVDRLVDEMEPKKAAA